MQKKQQIAPAGPLRGAFAALSDAAVAVNAAPAASSKASADSRIGFMLFCSSCRFPLRFTHFCKFASELFNKN